MACSFATLEGLFFPELEEEFRQLSKRAPTQEEQELYDVFSPSKLTVLKRQTYVRLMHGALQSLGPKYNKQMDDYLDLLN